MELPRPEARLADCVWLPRLIAKCRLFHQGKLPAEYVARLGHTSGVDGQFLRHFSLTKEQILKISECADSEIEAWFRGLAGVGTETVTSWNHIAVNLGRPGYAMAERLPIALRTSYAHLQDRGFQTVFEVLNADEGQTVGENTP